MDNFSDQHIKELQQRIAQGEEHAFNELFRAGYALLVRFAEDIVKVQYAAEEIVSDVFVNIWQNREKLTRIDHLKVFLYVSVRNRSYNYYRDNKVVIVELEKEKNVAEYIQHNPEEDLVVKELQKKLQDAIEELPIQCRQVYRLVKEDGLKYRDVAAILNIAPRTVETQLYRAVKKIRLFFLKN